jgi:hypothetical protein
MTPQERLELVADIAQVIAAKTPNTEILSDDEVRALKLLIKQQQQSLAFRQSIIEKSLSALLVAATLALCGMAAGWFLAHFYKP